MSPENCRNPFDASWPDDLAPLLRTLDAEVVRLRAVVRGGRASEAENAAYHEVMIARSLLRDAHRAGTAAAA